MNRKILSLCFVTTLLFGCGTVSFQTPPGSEPDLSETDPATPTVYIFATDYFSGGQLYQATIDAAQTTLSNVGLTQLGTEAGLYLNNQLLYILHKGGAYNSISTDNVQIVDPFDSENPFTTINQFSTGNGTNPQDIVVSDDRAFISLYNPSADPENIDAQGFPGDVVEMDLGTGEILFRYSFNDYLADDGDRNANAQNMIIADNRVYVLLQDLESNSFSATAPSKLGIIDVDNHTVLGALELEGTNPMSLCDDPTNQQLIIAHVADFDAFGSGGGIEFVDRSTQQTTQFFSDEDLDGYVERLRCDSGRVWAIVSNYDLSTFTFQSKVISFATDTTTAEIFEEFLGFANDIRDIFISGDYLWVSYRSISTSDGSSNPNIVVYDINTQETIGEPLVPVAAGISITG